jgi:transposase, IS30 family
LEVAGVPKRFLGEPLKRQVMDLLASGLGPMEVARRTGVSKTHVFLMNHQAGGVYRPARATYSDRFLGREDRYEVARLKEAGHSVRSIAGQLGRAPSTVSRELRRNVRAQTGRYEPEHADAVAYQRQQQGKAKQSKLSRSPRLRQEVQGMLDRRYSPEQVAGRLRLLYRDDPSMQVSHETIYQSLYVYPRGQLRRELQAHLRTGRTVRKRRRRAEVETRGRIVGAVSIHQRPEEVEGRLVPGHHEGDLIKGSMASNSAVGTIVERTTGYLTLVHLPDGYRAAAVADAVVEQLNQLPAWFAKTLTWDRGKEMAHHTRVTEQTGMQVYFADPYSAYQRGTNENTNGLIREYLPKGTDLSVPTAADLAAIANELNDRPRKRLGFHTPSEAFATLLAQHTSGVATLP